MCTLEPMGKAVCARATAGIERSSFPEDAQGTHCLTQGFLQTQNYAS